MSKNKNKKRVSKCKKNIVNGLIVTLILGILVSPFIFDIYLTKSQNKDMLEYTSKYKDKTPEDMVKDLFVKETVDEHTEPQDIFTNREENGSVVDFSKKDLQTLGILSIPKINLEIPVYDNTSNSALNNGSGVLEGTDLPIGKDNTHSIVTAHAGLSMNKQFTELGKLKLKDKFYMQVGNEIHAYEVDRIETIVPNDINNYIEREEDKEYVTLLTCTPLFVNTHRLLVRGYRVPYNDEVIKGGLHITTIGWILILLILLFIIYLIYNKIKDNRKKKVN